MASEIIVLSVGAPDGEGTRSVSLGMIIPITTVYPAAGVVSPFASLPELVQTAWAEDTGKIAALDGGLAAYYETAVDKTTAMDYAALLQAFDDAYLAVWADYNGDYVASWQYVGSLFDAPPLP